MVDKIVPESFPGHPWKASLWGLVDLLLYDLHNEVATYLGKFLTIVTPSMLSDSAITRHAALRALTRVSANSGMAMKAHIHMIVPILFAIAEEDPSYGENELNGIFKMRACNEAAASLVTIAGSVGPSFFKQFAKRLAGVAYRRTHQTPSDGQVYCRLMSWTRDYDAPTLQEIFPSSAFRQLLEEALPLIASVKFVPKNSKESTYSEDAHCGVMPLPHRSCEAELHLGDATSLALLATLLDATSAPDLFSGHLDSLSMAVASFLIHKDQFVVDIAGLILIALYAMASAAVRAL